MASKFTQKAQEALNFTLDIATELGHSYVGSEHLLLGLLSIQDSAAHKLLSSRSIRLDNVKNAVIELTGLGSPEPLSPSDMTPRTKRIIEGSAHVLSQNGGSLVGTEHLLMSLLSEHDCVAVRIMESLGASVGEITNDVQSYLDSTPKPKNIQPQAKETSDTKNERALTGYGRDLVEMARHKKFDPIIGREGESERVIQILSRRTKNNPCLIGEPGVGKTAVVEGLAERIACGDVPDILRNKKLISLDLPSMIAGAKYRGEFEDRLKKVLAEVAKDPNVIIFIDEIHTLIGAGAAEGAVDAANIIKPALARGELRVIGATTISEYRRHIEKDAALERRFHPVTVGEPTPTEALKILEGLRPKYEAHHMLKISDGALSAAIDLSVRYITDRFLPDKAIDLVDEAAARLRLKMFTAPPEHRLLEGEISRAELEKSEAISEQNFELAATLRDRENALRQKHEELRADWELRKSGEMPILSERDIADIVTQWTGVPVGRLLEGEEARLCSLEERICERVIGQDAAVAALCRAVRRNRTGLGDSRRPIGSFIFAGQTGVGKTELCRALADALFGSENALIRLDMSEYMERHSASKLIGSPPGYIGYGEGGLLTERVRRSPYSILLFDEIEKAHPDIFNLLLQILDNGVLTDSQGRRVNFRNSIIIMTTNLGSRAYGETQRVGFSASRESENAENEQRVKNELRRSFRPEFLNRIDEIIVFSALSDQDLVKIASIMISELCDRIESNGFFMEFDESVAREVARQGKSEEYGARPLRRAITRLLELPFSDAVLHGEIKKGDFITVKIENGSAVFKKKSAK